MSPVKYQLLYSGKVLSGFWGLWVLLFTLFYNSNLRYHLVVPNLQPEINDDGDLLRHGVKAIQAGVPDETIGLYFPSSAQTKPEIFQKVIEHATMNDSLTVLGL